MSKSVCKWPGGPAVCCRGLTAVLILVGAVSLSGCSANPPAGTARSPKPPQQARATPAAADASPQPAGPAMAASHGSESQPEPKLTPAERNYPQPPDGKWLKDDQGKEYFLMRLPKDKIRYVRLGEGVIQVSPGMQFRIAKEDDEAFYVRIDKPVPTERVKPAPSGPTEEEKQAIAAAYVTHTATSHRLDFEPFDRGLPESGQWRNGFDLADMNGDGNLDIVHGPARKQLSTPIIFLGDGKGAWQPWSQLHFPREPYDYGDVATADFNGDGIEDMALAMHLRGVLVLVGDGRGGFRTWSQGIDLGQVGSGAKHIFSSRTLAAVDWNRDGREDLLVLSEGPTNPRAVEMGLPKGALIYLNKGDGTWGREASTATANDVFGDSIAVADFNGDGRWDFVTGSRVQGRRDLLNLGKEDGTWQATEIGALRPAAFVWSVTTSDFDGDGHPDLAVAYSSYELGVRRNGIDVLLNRGGNPLSWERHPLEAGTESPPTMLPPVFSALGSGDLDGDGHPDLVALTEKGAMQAYLGAGDGSFTREQTPEAGPPSVTCRGYRVRLADVDGDGRSEIFADFAGEPGSEVFPRALLAQKGIPITCKNRGSIRAWTTRPVSSP